MLPKKLDSNTQDNFLKQSIKNIETTMPLLNTITTPYAEAFLQVAESRNEVDEVVTQAKSILELWNTCLNLVMRCHHQF